MEESLISDSKESEKRSDETEDGEPAHAQDAKGALRMEEFRAIRREIETNIADIRLAIRYALIGTGAVWAWVVTHEHVSSYAVFLPLGIILPGIIQTFQLMQETGTKGKYIHQIERSTGLGEEGWEHFLETQKPARLPLSPYMATWLMMILVVLIVGFVYQSVRASALSHPVAAPAAACYCSAKPEE